MEFNREKAFYYKSENKDAIAKTAAEHDFILVETTLNLPQVYDEDKKIINFKIDENLYFSSSKFCLINNKLYKFDKFIKKLNYVLICNDIVIKYNYKEERNELEKEINILKELDLNCKLIDSQKTDDYIVFSMNKIEAKNLKNCIPLPNINIKFNVLFQTLEQLLYLENNGYVYNDLSVNNVMYDEKIAYLIDYGSVSKTKNLYDFRNNSTGITIMHYFIHFLFTLFSNNKRVYYKKHVSFFNVLCNTNNYSWEEIILLKDFILFLQKNKVNYNDIMNYFKHKYYNYYLKFLVTTVVKNNVKTN